VDEDDEDDQTADAPYYPGKKMVNWWLVVGDATKRALYGIKIASGQVIPVLDLMFDFNVRVRVDELGDSCPRGDLLAKYWQVYDIMELEDDKRNDLLRMNERQM
jgi:hypothetical protein